MPGFSPCAWQALTAAAAASRRRPAPGLPGPPSAAAPPTHREGEKDATREGCRANATHETPLLVRKRAVSADDIGHPAASPTSLDRGIWHRIGLKPVSRPVTLFTGQWADLPLEDLAAKCGAWGFDGLELACWGDHFEVDKALADDGYVRSIHEILERNHLNVWALGAHLVGQAVCDRIDERHRAILPPEVWGDGDPAGVQARAAERMKDTARAAARLGVTQVNGFTGSSIWHLHLLVPAERLRRDRARVRAVRRGLEPDHRRLRRRGSPLRARGASHRDRLRLRHHAQDARRDRQPRGLRDQPRPLPLRAPVARHRAVRARVRRPDLPRPRQGLDQAPRTAAARSSART